MDLREFLGYFDFDYDIVPAGGQYEDKVRQELMEDGKLNSEDLGRDLICLVDLQGAYFGDIGKERFPIAADSAEKIVDRMDIYVQESVYDEFTDALENRGIDSGDLSLEEMIEKCRGLGVDSGEVCYPLAEAVAKPESIVIQEVQMQDKDYLRNVVIPGLMKDGITLQQISDELNYRDLSGVVDSHAGWDDDLIDYSTKELEVIEVAWSEGSIEINQVQDVFAIGLAKQLRDLMGDLIENGDGFWEDLSIRLPIVKDGLDGYGMVIRTVEDDAREQFFEVGVYVEFSEKDNGIQVLSEYTETDDLDELEAVTKGALVQFGAVRDIVADVREQLEEHDQASVRLENGRFVEVLICDEDLDEKDEYYVVQLLCNDHEYENNDYRKTDGVIDSYNCSGKDWNEVEEQVIRAIRCNESYPVAEWSRMDKDKLETDSLDKQIIAAGAQADRNLIGSLGKEKGRER